MEKFKINLDPKRYYEKAKVNAFSVNNNLVRNIEELSIEEIAVAVGKNGRAFSRALLKGGRCTENFVQQHFLVLDFDDTISYKEFKKRCEQKRLPFAFTYKTLSYSRKECKFRAVFVMNITVTDQTFAKAMNCLIHKVFPEDDQSCQDIPRMMYGGKGLIDVNYDARIDIMDLVYAAQDYMQETQPGNYSRDLQTLAKKIEVQICDGCLGFYKKEDIPDDLDALMVIQGDIVMVCREEEENSRTERRRVEKDNTGGCLRMIRGYDEETLQSLCPLLYDYIHAEEDMEHVFKYILASSLVHISGGKTIFFKYLMHHESKWKSDWERRLKKLYPKHCRGICPYSAKCNCDSLYQKLTCKIIQTSKVEKYFPLEVCVDSLDDSLHEAVGNQEEGIYLIKGQTALGKTEVYCRIVQEMTDKKFLIAVPTCKLQDEVAERLEEKGVSCYKTVSLYNAIRRLGIEELSDIVQKDYESGFGRQVKKRIRYYYEQHKEEMNRLQKRELKKILSPQTETEDARCIVTTHAYFLMMDDRQFSDYEVIIDEDLLMTLFKKNGAVPISDIRFAINNKIFSKENTEELKKILKLDHEEARKVKFQKLTDGQLERLYEKSNSFDGPMPLLLESTYVAKDKNKGEILFFQKTEIACRKMIILSASADCSLYETYFDGWKIHFMEIYQAKYTGKVVQYTAHSMSRKCMKMYTQEVVDEAIEKIAGPVPKITFKMFDPDGTMHFGKTEGFDEFKGRDIAVIGTPHNLPALYKMLGEALGYDSRDTLCKRRIERNGYSFCFMTFSDVNMQNLQLFFIETELEQAIGRARALRYDCTVYVFSNYPCAQAEIIQERYLPEIEKETADETEEEISDDKNDEV